MYSYKLHVDIMPDVTLSDDEKRDYLKNADFKIYEVDGHNTIPARFVSDKQEYSASTMRRKIY